MLRAAFIFSCVVVLLGSFDAAAFNRTMTSKGEPIAWPSACFYYSINKHGSRDIPFADLQEIVRKSYATWENVDCSYFYFEETEPAEVDEAAFHLDRGNVNLLVWREDSWPTGGAYTPEVIALSSVQYDDNTGRILDVDIEFNGVWNTFGSVGALGSDPGTMDLQSTLTHEIGHALGLEHASSPEATMFPSGGPGEIGKRDLADDDIDGVCEIYPVNDALDRCDEPYCGLDLTGTSTQCDRSHTGGTSSSSGGACSFRAPAAGPASLWRGLIAAFDMP